MTEFPILRLREPVKTTRWKKTRKEGEKSPAFPQPKGPSRGTQGGRFNPVFDRVSEALKSENPQVQLQQSPDGIAPDRAIVFETAGPIQNFFKVAQNAGMEVFGEHSIDELDDMPDGFTPPAGGDFNRVLYATLPTMSSLERLLAQWRKHQSGADPEIGFAPWWKVFDLLTDLRVWGPNDRFTEGARESVLSELPYDDNDTSYLELEIWPTANQDLRRIWREETVQKVVDLGGEIIDTSSLSEAGFAYEAMLVALRAGTIRELINNPDNRDNIGVLEGIQNIFPQSIAQTISFDDDVQERDDDFEFNDFEADLPFKAALLDGVSVAAHPALNGGISIEDINDIVPLSLVASRHHATSMGSLILRGDLNDDGDPVAGARVLNIPVLIDDEDGASSPQNRLLVDLIHYTLTRMFVGDDAVAQDVFVVNFSVGMRHRRFGNQVSSLARLLDWWSAEQGVLFVVSSGNIMEPLEVVGMNSIDFEGVNLNEKKALIRAAIKANLYERTLLAPSEALNALTVGALSEHKGFSALYPSAGIICLEQTGETGPSISSARGLGPGNSIKPDVVVDGGLQEVRFTPSTDDTRIQVVRGRRTGLKVASPNLLTTLTTGTSNAAAITTRSILQCAESLMGDGGAYQGDELPRRDIALLTRAIAINSAVWPESATPFQQEALAEHGVKRHAIIKKEVSKHFGFGELQPDRMIGSPEKGVTLVGLGTIRKDQGRVFNIPLPEDLSGDKVPRSMRVTIAWFTPVDLRKSSYRLAGLEAVSSAAGAADKDTEWFLKMKGIGPDDNMVKKGSIWSRRLINSRLTTPEYGEAATLPIRVQCRDVSGGGLINEEDIRFAIAVTLEVENAQRYDVFQQVADKLRIRPRL